MSYEKLTFTLLYELNRGEIKLLLCDIYRPLKVSYLFISNASGLKDANKSVWISGSTLLFCFLVKIELFDGLWTLFTMLYDKKSEDDGPSIGLLIGWILFDMKFILIFFIALFKLYNNNQF